MCSLANLLGKKLKFFFIKNYSHFSNFLLSIPKFLVLKSDVSCQDRTVSGHNIILSDYLGDQL